MDKGKAGLTLLWGTQGRGIGTGEVSNQMLPLGCPHTCLQTSWFFFFFSWRLSES